MHLGARVLLEGVVVEVDARVVGAKVPLHRQLLLPVLGPTTAGIRRGRGAPRRRSAAVSAASLLVDRRPTGLVASFTHHRVAGRAAAVPGAAAAVEASINVVRLAFIALLMTQTPRVLWSFVH